MKMIIRTLSELMDRIWEVCPNALFDEDSEGQLIINTGVRLDGDGELLPLPPP